MNLKDQLNSKNAVPVDAILSLAKQFITIPSTTYNPASLNEIISLASNELRDFEIENFVANHKPSLLIHNAKPGTKNFKIIFNAHLDVIEGKDEQFVPRIRDNKLYGRGSYDMKAAAAVMICLFKDIAKKINYPLALQITADEETGCYGAEKQVKEGIRAEFVITGECGNNFKITNKTKGICHMKVIADGVASHGAYPWNGDNAVIKLHKALANILIKYPPVKEESHQTTVNITRVYTNNQTTNKTPDHCEAYLDIRYAPEDKNIFTEIKNMLPQGVRAESIFAFPPLDTDENNSYLKLLQQEGKKILNQEVQLRFTHGTSELVRFVEVGCNGVEFGPIGANQHAKDEYIEIKSLEQYYMILKQFLMEIDAKETVVK